MSIELFKTKKDCCGCGACITACPRHAISMEADENRFLYPVIDEKACVECGLCKKACKYSFDPMKQDVSRVVVATINEKSELMQAASGGVFTAAAKSILENNGVVFGATLTFENGHANPHHIMVDSKEELWRLQGSKYVQSVIGDTYKQAESYLKKGFAVLFSGTPCQIVGLKGYLRKEYDNLYTIDLICHGVPSQKLFDDYIQDLNKRYHGQITQYRFRDKTKGWGMNTAFDITVDGTHKTIFKPARLESYPSFFLDCKIYRENCYSCPYAAKTRVGDITIGDFWGIEKAHPELMERQEFQESKGISCLLVNSEQGELLLNAMKGRLNVHESTLEKAAMKNAQLKRPSKRSSEREAILRIYRQSGYEGVKYYFSKNHRKQIVIHTIYNSIPRKIRLWLKSALGK